MDAKEAAAKMTGDRLDPQVVENRRKADRRRTGDRRRIAVPVPNDRRKDDRRKDDRRSLAADDVGRAATDHDRT